MKTAQSKKLNVLSIDWDYFFKASANTRADLFPDGGNEKLPTYLQSAIWCNRYASSDKLSKVRLDSQVLAKVLDVCNASPVKMFIVAESHQSIYEFVKYYSEYAIKSAKFGGLNLVNIDFHHDMFNFNMKEVNCGNWLNHFMDEYKDSSFTWVARKDSQLSKDKRDLKSRYDLNFIKDTAWDIVFVCRSGMWSPPHLDKQFSSAFQDMARDLKLRFVFPDDVLVSRYSEDFLESVKVQKEVYKSVKAFR